MISSKGSQPKTLWSLWYFRGRGGVIAVGNPLFQPSIGGIYTSDLKNIPPISDSLSVYICLIILQSTRFDREKRSHRDDGAMPDTDRHSVPDVVARGCFGICLFFFSSCLCTPCCSFSITFVVSTIALSAEVNDVPA